MIGPAGEKGQGLADLITLCNGGGEPGRKPRLVTRLVDGQWIKGVQTAGGFIHQVRELQPVGHWLEPDGSMTPAFARPGFLERLVNRLTGARFIDYPKRPA
jgi:hypothetical protein